jgi:predicted transcriptional regulator
MKEIRARIAYKGFKKGWIAKQLGIPKSTLSSYLNETRTIPEKVLRELKQLLA